MGADPADDTYGDHDTERFTSSLIGSETEVYQATGMISGQLGVSLEEALGRLRGYAFAHNRLVGEVARDIVSRRLRLDED